MQFESTKKLSFVSSFKELGSRFFSGEDKKLRGEEEGRINILLLGRAGERYPGRNLTDTVMIMSIDTKKRQVALLSLPRDLYVPIGDQAGFFTKLNAVYQYGLSNGLGIAPIIGSVETVIGTDIHYFMTLDFDGFEKIIDTVGGISVNVPRDFYDSRYPGKNYSYETFELKKGWQTLDGATALKYVRERHDDPEGDFGRAKRQQQVLQAVKNKVFSLGTLLSHVTTHRLMETLGESVKTDLTLDDIARLSKLAREIDTQNVTNVVIDAWKKESLLRVSHVDVSGVPAFILVPRVGNWSEIQDVNTNIFERTQKEQEKIAIQKEAPTLTLYGKGADRAILEKIALYIREELFFPTVTVLTISPLDKRPERSIMREEGVLEKPFSTNELLRRFSPERVSDLPIAPNNKVPTSDFDLLVGSELISAFSLDDTPENFPLEDATFSVPLPPQPKKKSD